MLSNPMMRAAAILSMSILPFASAQAISARELLHPESRTHWQPDFQPASNQWGGQISYLGQHDAPEQSLGQSDGCLPGPGQSLNQYRQTLPCKLVKLIADTSGTCPSQARSLLNICQALESAAGSDIVQHVRSLHRIVFAIVQVK